MVTILDNVRHLKHKFIATDDITDEEAQNQPDGCLQHSLSFRAARAKRLYFDLAVGFIADALRVCIHARLKQ